MKRQISTSKIPRWAQRIRLIMRLLYGLLFPGSTIDAKGILPLVEEEVQNGKGLLIIYNHFGYRDPVDLGPYLMFKSPVLISRKIVSPISFHQYNNVIEKLIYLLQVTLFPVVNQDTLKRKGFEHLDKGKGLPEFIDKSATILSQGGIAILAVNAGRREYLDFEDKQRPVGFFMLAAQRKGLSHYGILLVSFGIKDARSYTKKAAGGVNFRRKYTLTLARYYDSKELLDQPEISGRAANVDLFIRKKLAEVAPKEYLPKNYKQ